jgi:hypothetical protein
MVAEDQGGCSGGLMKLDAGCCLTTPHVSGARTPV